MAGKAKKAPETVDFYRKLGSAIRFARITAGKTQSEAADEIGVSFQQLQKYEKGSNRIPIEQLVAFCGAQPALHVDGFDLLQKEISPPGKDPILCILKVCILGGHFFERQFFARVVLPKSTDGGLLQNLVSRTVVDR